MKRAETLDTEALNFLPEEPFARNLFMRIKRPFPGGTGRSRRGGGGSWGNPTAPDLPAEYTDYQDYQDYKNNRARQNNDGKQHGANKAPRAEESIK